jgi:hypothetical protein
MERPNTTNLYFSGFYATYSYKSTDSSDDDDFSTRPGGNPAFISWNGGTDQVEVPVMP